MTYATETFVETLTTLIDERIAVALDRHITSSTTNGWLTTQEAADYIGSPRSRIYDLVSFGHLCPSRDGSRLKFTRAQLDRYMETV